MDTYLVRKFRNGRAKISDFPLDGFYSVCEMKRG